MQAKFTGTETYSMPTCSPSYKYLSSLYLSKVIQKGHSGTHTLTLGLLHVPLKCQSHFFPPSLPLEWYSAAIFRKCMIWKTLWNPILLTGICMLKNALSLIVLVLNWVDMEITAKTMTLKCQWQSRAMFGERGRTVFFLNDTMAIIFLFISISIYIISSYHLERFYTVPEILHYS